MSPLPLPPHAPLCSAQQLLDSLNRGVVVLDCGFDLTDTEAGQRAHRQARIRGSRYAHLALHLSGPHAAGGPAQGGRHPLPTREAWAHTVATWGIGPDTPVVAYDAQGGPYAARAWWLLKALGHEAVWVLDGGWSAWLAAQGPVDAGPEAAGGPLAPPHPGLPWPALPTVSADALQAQLGRVLLVDARAGERYRGEVEPLDTQAGHIPGAVNRCFKDNLLPNGHFKPAAQLREEWQRWGVQREFDAGHTVVHQCGSGVTACHNILAMVQAGWPISALYPGSWSEWSAQPQRPVSGRRAAGASPAAPGPGPR